MIDSTDLCNERSQTCRCCAPGELQCDGLSLKQCVAGCQWESVSDCATPELCDATVLAFGSTSAPGRGNANPLGACQAPTCVPSWTADGSSGVHPAKPAGNSSPRGSHRLDSEQLTGIASFPGQDTTRDRIVRTNTSISVRWVSRILRTTPRSTVVYP